jgi:hypothetical protein
MTRAAVMTSDVQGEHQAPGIPAWMRDRGRVGMLALDDLARTGRNPEGLPDALIADAVRRALRRVNGVAQEAAA